MTSEFDPRMLLRALTVEEWLAGRSTVLRLHSVYRKQKRASIVRRIGFLLSFREWIEIWTQSGKLDQRGRRRGQYAMARFGDVGPYAVGNVKIITMLENRLERRPKSATRRTPGCVAKLKAAKSGKKRPPFSKKWRANIAEAHIGIPRTPEWLANQSAAAKDRVFSAEHCKNISIAQRKRLAKRNPLRGRTLSAEHRARISATKRKQLAQGVDHV